MFTIIAFDSTAFYRSKLVKDNQIGKTNNVFIKFPNTCNNIKFNYNTVI